MRFQLLATQKNHTVMIEILEPSLDSLAVAAEIHFRLTQFHALLIAAAGITAVE